ncbi:hypothetical protein HMPREF0972_00271 [Actinomyces sp. oral taxon 848 str. F0332]|nr:hypothetical protein HMPREF0972_00271 [Actinomyces sp. oral taxon 848 str. F0332]
MATVFDVGVYEDSRTQALCSRRRPQVLNRPRREDCAVRRAVWIVPTRALARPSGSSGPHVDRPYEGRIPA